jgi:photosystem II S4 domain protein
MKERLSDLCDRSLRTWQTQCTNFLAPPETAEATAYLSKLTDVQFLAWGGYPQAERQKLAIAPTALELTTDSIPLSALDIRGNFLFDPASHRDFLGAILGTGIERDQVGDVIVLGDTGAQAIVSPQIAEYLVCQLTQVRTVPVKTQIISLSELKMRPPQKKEIVTIEASLRLDAVASAGFAMSRAKMVELINNEEVRVNWRQVSSPSYQLRSGDLVAVRGKGRLEIGNISITKKNRYRIQLWRLT